jgi:hypothetical protein
MGLNIFVAVKYCILNFKVSVVLEENYCLGKEGSDPIVFMINVLPFFFNFIITETPINDKNPPNINIPLPVNCLLLSFYCLKMHNSKYKIPKSKT